ncbi:hypothetical protein LCGC14_1103670 [marine sediment metagenome]|uniref:Carbohydrate-binding/sugar hydrolysis domain-containing protein n=1 Tax=marine sediment metagenome TaxID=412755 RepID=A0A0F9M8T7_9ZZZZ
MTGSTGGIKIKNSHDKYFSIRNCSVYWDGFLYSGLEVGIYLENTTKGEVINNTVDSVIKGIYLFGSDDNRIINNTVHHQMAGILIGFSDFNYVEDNTVYSNEDGFQITGSDNNTVIKNLVRDNTNTGFRLFQGHYNTFIENQAKSNTDNGIHLSNSDDNTFSGNLISNNPDGIDLYVSDGNHFYENILTLSGRGIFADDGDGGSHNNLANSNMFIGNTIHAIDRTSTNDWNNSVIGNFWDNYTGSDSNNNGIGDVPHSFDGGIDYLPIWDDSAPIINIITPANNSFVTRHSPDYSIEITDPYLNEMWYTLDGGITNITFISNGTINQTLWGALWNTLSNGDIIIIKFYADDLFGYVSSIEVHLIVNIPASATVPGYPLFLIMGIFMISLIFISRRIIRRTK